MKKLATLGAAALALTLTTQAHAEGWTVTDFNSVETLEGCMTNAETMFQTYRDQYGAPGFTGRGSWTVGAYDLRGEVVDAVFICADEAGFYAPFLVLHNTDDDSDARELIADRLGDIWDDIVEFGAPQGGGGSTGGGGAATGGGK
jgi:hypothetical protein